MFDMSEDIQHYNDSQTTNDKEICELLCMEISKGLPEATCKVWHGAPVWFLDDNPIVGYSKRKDCVNLLFWSGQSFAEPSLSPEGKFKAAEIKYTDKSHINLDDLKRWLGKAERIQWDYKNIVKKRGQLDRIK